MPDGAKDEESKYLHLLMNPTSEARGAPFLLIGLRLCVGNRQLSM